jgi:hypothetical protein
VKQPVCPTPRTGVKPEDLFTDAEVTQLMRVFTRGKMEVLEDDCCTLLAWAQEQRLRSLLLQWILEGSLQPYVINGEVCFGPPEGAHPGGKTSWN